MSRESRPSDLVILCYHAVSDDWPWEGSITPATLERQVSRLLRRGYVPLTLSEAVAAHPRGRSLAITFDDGFDSVISRGLPVLERLEAPATVFMPTDFPGESMTWSELGRWVGTSFEGELECMSWEGARRLAAAGWEIGSHTCSHPRLTELTTEEAGAELNRSRAECEERLQQPCHSLAYPFGDCDSRVESLSADAGYRNAVTLGERLLGPRERRDRLRLSREGVYRSTSAAQFALATSPLLGWVRGRPALSRRFAA